MEQQRPRHSDAAEVEVVEGVEYSSVAGLRLDLYRPRVPHAPATLYFHGGAWAAGSRADGAARARALAARGVAVAAVDYRHTPEHVFPAQWQDAAAAAAWLHTHAAGYGLGERIGAWGASAGGHLAALLGTAAPDTAGESLTAGPLVDAAACWFAPLVLTERRGRTPLERRLLATPAEDALVHGLDAAAAREADPYERADARAVPFLLVHGDRDQLVPPSCSLRFHDRLSASGVPCQTVLLAGAGHEDPLFDSPAEIDRVAAFFRATLAAD